MAEQLTFNQLVQGSTPWRPTLHRKLSGLERSPSKRTVGGSIPSRCAVHMVPSSSGQGCLVLNQMAPVRIRPGLRLPRTLGRGPGR